MYGPQRRLAPAAALLLGSLLAAPSAAQSPVLPVRLGVHLGVASPSSGFQSACGHAHFALGATARTRGRWFASAAGEVYSQGFGTEVGCVMGGPRAATDTHVTGGLDMESASRLRAGVGRTLPLGWADVEAELGAGLLRGRPGYDDGLSPEEADRVRWAPWLGGTVRARLFGAVEVAWERGRAELPFREEVYASPVDEVSGAPPAGVAPLAVRESRRWADLGVLTFGLRW